MENILAWTETTRPLYDRDGTRYASGLTDSEWALVEPLLPERSKLGRPPKTGLRRVIEAIHYMATTGCQWRMLPKEFPPYSTVQGCFYGWRDNGRWFDQPRTGDGRA